jgi:arylsulfotransferase ASST
VPAVAVTVSPLPGTPDASSATQISFLGGPGTRVSDVAVRGSLSGRHGGRLQAYSTGTGESFLPSRAFAPGERVSVSARVRRGTSAWQTVATHFRVAVQAGVSQAQFPPDPGDPADVQHYLSAPALSPSTVAVTAAAAVGATPGDFFLAPYQGAGTAGPMIVDQSGGLIWFHPLAAGLTATDFRTQTYDGRSVLTWWQGRILKLGFGQGRDQIYDSSYQPIAQVAAGNGYDADLHQFLLTRSGTAWIDAVDPVEVDLARQGGAVHGVVSDSIVQEIDVRTGLVMWEWHALGHIPLLDSYAPAPHDATPWYYAHVNSIDPSRPGQLLISARNTWTIYDVKLHTGAIAWRLGGRRSSFALGPGTAFHFQHDAAWQPGGLVSVFDNGGAEERQSRGLLLDPDPATRRVTLVRAFINPGATLRSDSQGDLLALAGGNWLMGYGGLPNFTEFNATGQVLLDATLGPGVQDYRTYLASWSATPSSRPAIAAQAEVGGTLSVEASWNGATAVSAWDVLAGSSASTMSVVATVPRRGFETSISLAVQAPLVAVAALGAGGQVLGSSAAISPSG